METIKVTKPVLRRVMADSLFEAHDLARSMGFRNLMHALEVTFLQGESYAVVEDDDLLGLVSVTQEAACAHVTITGRSNKARLVRAARYVGELLPERVLTAYIPYHSKATLRLAEIAGFEVPVGEENIAGVPHARMMRL